ncbi:MAG TPA: acyl-CoA thioesterase [Planctomycetes bacterium]|nr:acyl-CoA thioesterase [Planctomycetota bacterium]
MTPTAPRSFVTQLSVRFGDVDPAGIVYFPKIYDYLHEAFEDLWDVHVGRRYYYLVGRDKLGFPLVHSEVDFKHPLHFGDRPTVRVTCFKIGRSSIGLCYKIMLDDILCVFAKMTVVCVDIDTLETRPIPPDYRERFEAILEEDCA